MSEQQLHEKFQLLTREHNLWKSRYCEHCKETGERGTFIGIDYFYSGGHKWDKRIGSNDEEGCIGCFWYNPDIWRIIDIKENQMLSSLHKAIFKAFDRVEEHQYSFFLSTKPYDRESEYTSPGLDTDGTNKLATRIRIDSIALHGGPNILYLFDYGDEWWHEVELISVTERVTRASYPRVVKKQGKSPPQYPKH